MPRRSPTSSFEHPAAMSSMTSTCRSVNLGNEARSASYMARSYSADPPGAIDRKEYFAGLRRDAPPTHEARLVPALVRGGQLFLIQCAGSQQQVELVAKVRTHHFRAVRGDRKLHAVVDERPEGFAHRVLVRQRLCQQVRSGTDLEDDLGHAQRVHQLLIAGGEDSVADPVRS